MLRLALAALAAVLCSGVQAQQVGLTPVTTSTGASLGIVAKAAPGSAYSVFATNLTNTAGFLVGYNAIALPADGALTAANVIQCAPIAAANSTTQQSFVDISDEPGPPTNYSVGIVYFFTSAATCYTKTTGVITGFISAKVQ